MFLVWLEDEARIVLSDLGKEKRKEERKEERKKKKKEERKGGSIQMILDCRALCYNET